MALSAEQRETYRILLDTYVLMGDLHNLLKIYKDDNKTVIRLSGTKHDLIENLLDATDSRIIDITLVQALIKDSEEYGDQHIFVFTLDSMTNKPYYDNSEILARRVIPSGCRDEFPRLMNVPSAVEWADFRHPNRGVANSWLMKLYDVKSREVRETDRFDSSTSRRTIVYKVEFVRLVYIIEWDGESQVEIKVSRTYFDSAKGLKKSLAEVKNLIYGAANGVMIDRDFSKHDFTQGINNVILNSDRNQEVYKLILAKFRDSQGAISTIQSVDDSGDQDLMSEDSRREAIEAFLNGDSEGTTLVMRFLATGSNNALQNDINVIIAREDVNHLIIPAKIKPQEYRYVRRKISEFSQPIP